MSGVKIDPSPGTVLAKIEEEPMRVDDRTGWVTT